MIYCEKCKRHTSQPYLSEQETDAEGKKRREVLCFRCYRKEVGVVRFCAKRMQRYIRVFGV